MNPGSRSSAAEDLLLHRRWVRELAERLVRDPAAAEDLEQQTWLAALRSPPQHARTPRAWLGTVLRSWLAKARRGDQRRSRRERLVAPRGATPSTAEIVAEAEAHRCVVDAVFRLDEPLRTTVLLRFFEDLPIGEAAVRTGVPLETAKSRIRRALELLRAMLDRDAGGRGAWQLALAPLARAGAHAAAPFTASVVLEAIVMKTTQKVMVAAVLLLGGAAAFLLSMQDPVTPIGATDAASAVAATAGAAVADPGSGGELADRARAGGVEVTVLVRTWSDEPVEGAVVEACAPLAEASDANEYDRPPHVAAAKLTTDAAGTVHFTGLAAGRWHFLAAKEGWCRSGVPDVALRYGVAGSVLIRLGLGHVLTGRVLAGDGRAVAGAMVAVFPTSSALVRPRTTTDAQGRFRFEALRAGPTCVAAALPGGTVSPVETVQVPEVTELDLVLRTGGILVGSVTDQSGQPIQGARVRAQTSRTGGYYRPVSAEAVTNVEGRYRIDTLGEGLIHEVTASKEGFVQVADAMAGNFDALIPFRDGGTWTKDLVLGRGGRLVVTVRGPDGPVAGALVTLHQPLPRTPVVSKAEADGGGVATFAAIAPLRTLVAVRADGMRQPGFPTDSWQVLTDPTARSECLVEVQKGAEATIEVALVRAAAIHGRVLAAGDAPLAGVSVNHANADASSAVVTGADGSFRLTGVRAGSVPLAIAKAGFVVVGATVAEVPTSGDCTGLVLHMSPAPRVHGTVRAAGGRLGEAFVQVSMVPDREQEWQEEFRWANTERQPIAVDGTYDVPLPRAEGRFAVRAVALAHPVVTSAPVDIEPDSASYALDLELQAGCDLVGRIVAFGSGDAVPGARVRAEWLAPGIDAARRIRGPELSPVRAVTDRAGNFVLRNLQPGRFEIQAIADGYLAETAIAALPQANDLVLALPAELSLEGVVQYPDGAPVAGAQLMPQPQQGNRSMSIGIDQMTMSAPDGRFKIPRVSPGQYRISVSPPRTGTANFRRMETGIVAAGTRDLRIVVEPGASIAGRVVDGEGRGIVGVSVAARASSDVRSGVETLRDGTFTLVGLEDGASYTVVVNPSGRNRNNPYANLQRPHVAAGTTGLEFVLQPGLAIAGVVVDGAGSPRQGIEIAAMPVGTEDPYYGPIGRSDQDGTFEIRGLQPGRYRLAIPQWYASGLLLRGGDDVAAGAADLRLTATEGARIRGIVVDENGAPLAGIDVEADAAQASVHGGTWTQSRADGGFDLTGLVPDAAYDVSARRRGRVPARQGGVVAGSAGIRLVLARGLEVQGRLLDGSGKPLVGINLRFVHGASGLRAAARTEADGAFAASGLLPGSYTVEASMGTAARLDVVPCGTVDAGQRGVELRLGR